MEFLFGIISKDLRRFEKQFRDIREDLFSQTHHATDDHCLFVHPADDPVRNFPDHPDLFLDERYATDRPQRHDPSHAFVDTDHCGNIPGCGYDFRIPYDKVQGLGISAGFRCQSVDVRHAGDLSPQLDPKGKPGDRTGQSLIGRH